MAAAGGGGEGAGLAAPMGSGDASGVAVALGVAVADASGVAVTVVSGTGTRVTVGVALTTTGAELSGVEPGGEVGIRAGVAPAVAAVEEGQTVGPVVSAIGVAARVGEDRTLSIGVTAGTTVACNGLKPPSTLGPDAAEVRVATMANNESPGDTALNCVWLLDRPLTQVDSGIQPSENLANVMASGS